MHFNQEKKSLDISVREIAHTVESSQSDGYVSRRLRARIGHDAHNSYQMYTDGDTEYYVKFYERVEDWTVQIRGRVDIVHKNGNEIHLEEIKSTTVKFEEFEENATHILQLQLYCYYFYKHEGYSNITADLVIIDPVNDKQHKISVEPGSIETLLHDQLSQLIQEYEQDMDKREQLKGRIATIQFPYPSYRRYQVEIIEKLENLISKQERVMLHAPPGIGKTITTFYPTLRHVIKEGKRLFIVTSKTTQQIIYTEAINDLQEEGGVFKAIRITAKGKMCRIEEYDCYDLECPYLENYFHIDNRPLVSDLLELDLIEREPIEQMAEKHHICPFELSLDTAIECDVILSDFNYIFHPRVRFQRFQEEFDNSVLIVDEAHNLVDRASDFYSETLSIKHIKEVIDFVKSSSASSSVKYDLKIHLKKLVRHVQRLKDQIQTLELEHSLITIDRDFFENYQDKLDHLSIEYLNSLPFEPQKKDFLIKFTDHLKFFTLLLRETEEPEFEEIYDILERQVRIFCKSAAKKLTSQMDEFDSVIVQSATLEPIEYYKEMLGLPDQTKILKYPNPFPKENRLYLIDSSISTTYKERYLFLDELSDLIVNIIEIQQGNYLVFFSSFEYLNNVKQRLILKTNKTVLVQHTKMSDRKRKKVLNQLKSETNIIVLAVMGGVFSEGVDYVGDIAVGAFIVGPALPTISFDQELKKEYFDQQYGKGFDYAYRYPGMSKVIQAAGRVFRSDTDKGFVIFVGHRFRSEQYRSLLPADYDISVDNIEETVRLFWINDK